MTINPTARDAILWALANHGRPHPECRLFEPACSECANDAYRWAAAAWIMEQAQFLGLIALDMTTETFHYTGATT